MHIARSTATRSGDPGRQKTDGGYFDPGLNYNGCGVGSLARLDGEPSHAVVHDGLRALVNLEHRGALGDGAGLMTAITDGFFREALK